MTHQFIKHIFLVFKHIEFFAYTIVYPFFRHIGIKGRTYTYLYGSIFDHSFFKERIMCNSVFAVYVGVILSWISPTLFNNKTIYWMSGTPLL